MSDVSAWLPSRPRTSQMIMDDALRAEIRSLLLARGLSEEDQVFKRFVPPGKTLDTLDGSYLRDIFALCERTRVADLLNAAPALAQPQAKPEDKA